MARLSCWNNKMILVNKSHPIRYVIKFISLVLLEWHFALSRQKKSGWNCFWICTKRGVFFCSFVGSFAFCVICVYRALNRGIKQWIHKKWILLQSSTTKRVANSKKWLLNLLNTWANKCVAINRMRKRQTSQLGLLLSNSSKTFHFGCTCEWNKRVTQRPFMDLNHTHSEMENKWSRS